METLKVDLDLVPRDEWVRLAAFIDGEGSIGIRFGTSTSIYVKVTNTAHALPAWLYRVFGGRIQKDSRSSRGKTKRKDTYVWIVDRDYAAKIISMCAPYFIIKSAQAEVALALRATTGQSKGGRTRDQSVVVKRQELHSELHRLNRRGLAASE